VHFNPIAGDLSRRQFGSVHPLTTKNGFTRTSSFRRPDYQSTEVGLQFARSSALEVKKNTTIHSSLAGNL
jgi:hypothetical protein